MHAAAAQLTGLPHQRHPMREAEEDQQDLGGATVCTIQIRSGKGSEDQPAGSLQVVQR